MGEAYACRALMHFDLLRLFAPALINDDQGTYVPYVDTYPEIYATSMQVAPFLDKVIADLSKSKKRWLQILIRLRQEFWQARVEWPVCRKHEVLIIGSGMGISLREEVIG